MAVSWARFISKRVRKEFVTVLIQSGIGIFEIMKIGQKFSKLELVVLRSWVDYKALEHFIR